MSFRLIKFYTFDEVNAMCTCQHPASILPNVSFSYNKTHCRLDLTDFFPSWSDVHDEKLHFHHT